MGKIELDHTGSGSGVTLSSDGTDLLLDGTAIGGGGGAALDLYAENYDGTSTKPSATGSNGIALGRLAVASGNRSIAVGGGATATGLFSTALTNSYASGGDAFAAAISTGSSSYGATGSNSVAIGENAKATASDSVAVGSGAYGNGNGAVALGFNNESRSYAFTAGRESTATGFVATAIGYNVGAYHDESVALGRLTQTRVRSSIAFGSYGFGSSGDCQSGLYVLNRFTTDATAAPLVVNGYYAVAASSSNQIVLPNNSAYAFHGTIVARQQASAGTASAAWRIEGLIRREGSAGTTVLVNSATTVLDNTPSWGLTLSADTTNGCLQITGTGAASTNIRWVATIHTSEVTYA